MKFFVQYCDSIPSFSPRAIPPSHSSNSISLFPTALKKKHKTPQYNKTKKEKKHKKYIHTHKTHKSKKIGNNNIHARDQYAKAPKSHMIEKKNSKNTIEFISVGHLIMGPALE